MTRQLLLSSVSDRSVTCRTFQIPKKSLFEFFQTVPEKVFSLDMAWSCISSVRNKSGFKKEVSVLMYSFDKSVVAYQDIYSE